MRHFIYYIDEWSQDKHERPDDAAVRERYLLASYGSPCLGYYFAKQKDDKCENTGHDTYSYAAPYIDGKRCRKSRCGDVDDIVADKHGTEHFTVSAKYLFNAHRIMIAVACERTNTYLIYRSKCGFCGREESGKYDKYDKENDLQKSCSIH